MARPQNTQSARQLSACGERTAVAGVRASTGVSDPIWSHSGMRGVKRATVRGF